MIDKEDEPRLLSGGNPQMPKGDGDASVQAYIAAMPGWKQAIGRRIDSTVSETVPGVRKAVKWNSPFYGSPDGKEAGWFLVFHCFNRYVKITFFRGQSLSPMPPEPSKSGDTRYVHIHEDQDFDWVQFADWVRQAHILPG